MAITAQNEEFILLPSASRTGTQTSSDLANLNGTKMVIVLDMTVNAGGLGSATIAINGKDAASGKYYNLLTGAAVTTVSTNRYVVANDATAAANVSAKDYLPSVLQVVVTGNANPTTFSVGYCLLRG